MKIAVFCGCEYDDGIWTNYYEIDKQVDEKKFIDYVGDFLCFAAEVADGITVEVASDLIKQRIEAKELEYKVRSDYIEKFKNYTKKDWEKKDKKYWSRFIGCSGCFFPPSQDYIYAKQDLPNIKTEIKELKGILK